MTVPNIESWRRRWVLALPWLWAGLFFLLPLAFVVKISLAEARIEPQAEMEQWKGDLSFKVIRNDASGGTLYPTVYFSDGGAYVERMAAPKVLDRLIAAKAVPPLVAVLIVPPLALTVLLLVSVVPPLFTVNAPVTFNADVALFSVMPVTNSSSDQSRSSSARSASSARSRRARIRSPP